MIEELTPQILISTMFLLLVVVPSVTLMLSIFLLYLYRKGVKRLMAANVGFEAPIEEVRKQLPSTDSIEAEGVSKASGETLFRRIRLAPWYNAMRYLFAAFAFALVFATAAQFVYPSGLGLPGFFVGVWIYLWPFLLALPMLIPAGLRRWILWIIAYVMGFAILGFWASTALNLPEYRVGALVLPARSSVTPVTLIKLWLVVNAPPTLLMLLCFNRWVVGVAPLVLALVSATVAGLLGTYFSLYSAPGVDAAIAVSVTLQIHIYWLLLAVLVLALSVFGTLGWLWVRWIAWLYRRERLSDQSLLLDSLWLLFASAYGMWLVHGGVVWIVTIPVAFVTFKLTWKLLAKLTPGKREPAAGLTFLRVFSLGRRSEALLDIVARYWRHVGSIQLITGPDLARSTVQPHQFLDFLSGKLARHFINDQGSLERSLGLHARGADPDGRFRINNFFCHADSWKAVLPRLVQEGDLVLMDLRSFSTNNDGCIHEIRYLLAEVPLYRCLFVVDESTDKTFMDEIFKQAWNSLPVDSINHGHALSEFGVLQLDSVTGGIKELNRQLCERSGLWRSVTSV